MSKALYKKTDYSVTRLIDEIDTGEIGLPDIREVKERPISVTGLGRPRV